MLLMSLEREARPETGPMPIPPAPAPAPLKRDRRIQLFESDSPAAAPVPRETRETRETAPAPDPAAGESPGTVEAVEVEVEETGDTAPGDAEKTGWRDRIRTFWRTH